MRICAASTGDGLVSIALHYAPVSGIAVVGDYIVTCSEDRRLRAFERRFPHTMVACDCDGGAPVAALDMTYDGTGFFTASHDRTLKVIFLAPSFPF